MHVTAPVRMTVMVMSERSADFTGTDILSMAAELIAARQPFVLSIVIEAKGSTSARAGAKAIFDAEGAVIAGWVGGGCAESAVAHAAVESIETGTPQIVDIDLDDEVLGAGMPCGGNMRVYVEPVVPRPTLWILGHGRVAECLCHLGALMSFNVVIDDVMATPDRYPDASRVIADDADYSALKPVASDFVIIATQHRGDHESLRRLLTGDVGYIALIASRKRTGLVMAYLREAGCDQRAIERIRAPAGIELGARTAEEIALSVISETVLVHRQRNGRRQQPGPNTRAPVFRSQAGELSPAHVPEKACPGLEPGWAPVFRKGHAPTQEARSVGD
jgi:xanthine dehydrogenase accessory factor